MTSRAGWERTLRRAYGLWACAAIGLSLAVAGWCPQSQTRVMVLAFLLAQLLFRARLARSLPNLSPRDRFVALGMLLAAAVEGFHMVSMPVFPGLKVGPGTTLSQALHQYFVDLAYTEPAYLVIFLVLWRFASRYRWGLWEYAVVAGLAQTLGDGGLFFFASSPGMLLFLPYPMSNYQAVNVLPLIACGGPFTAQPASWRRYLVIPALVVTYLICGTLIQLVGRYWGFAQG